MLQPKNYKFPKQHKGRIRGVAWKCNQVVFGSYGLKALGTARLTSAQIEAARRVISRTVKRGGKLWIRKFPDVSVTQKPIEVRQGKGKGNIEYWIARIKPGAVIYELDGVSKKDAMKAFSSAAAKLPFKAQFIERDQFIR